MELRQAQQSALLRQDEITQLHRDNERLLAEGRGLMKEMRQAQELLQQSSEREKALAQRTTLLETERPLLQERLRVALEQSTAIKQQLDEQHAANKALEIRAIKAETALENTPGDPSATVAAPTDKDSDSVEKPSQGRDVGAASPRSQLD